MSTQYKPTLEEVRQLADRGNLIPIYRELPADLETPVSVYLKLRASTGGPSFLLESVEKGEQVGRYSFIGVHAPMTVTAWGNQVTIGGAGGAVLERQQGNPFDLVKDLLAGRQAVKVPGLPTLAGGVVGYFAYDMVRFIERLPETASRDLDVADMMLLFSDNLVVFDHVRHRLLVVAN
ncbi:MAG: anthranilate synthase component I, partial [Caldilineaceae bacterium]|nr:anthranilate synthase component I [Caldilineaceae bacterium]